MADRSTAFFLGGAAVGAALGYLAGPTIPFLGGRLPILTVVTFGADLQGLNQVLSGLAQSAGKLFYGGALVFGLIGFAIGRSMKSRDGGASA